MRRKFKTGIGKRVSAVMRGNEGASIVLVTIISILIISGVIILRTTTSALWASADKQLYQDQAYEIATSMGNSLDVLIVKDNKIKLDTIAPANGEGVIIPLTEITDLPNSNIKATVSKDADNSIYTVKVSVNVAQASYVYTAKYTGSGNSYKRLY